MLRTLRQPRWIWLTLAVLAASLLFVRLGLWQWHRAQAKWDSNDAVTQLAGEAPVPAADVLAVGAAPAEGDEWRQVTATGTYAADRTVLVRSAVLDGDRGYYVVVPLRTDAGPALLVNRGFIPATGGTRTAPTIPAPPSGEVTVVGRVRMPATGDLQTSDQFAPPSVRRIIPDAIAGEVALGEVFDAYVQLTSESPEAADTPRAPELPEADVGLNLAYAAQWWAFVAVAWVGWFVLLRRDTDETREDELTASGHTSASSAERTPQ